MWSWLCEQWYLLIIGFPFMFLASLSDLFVPDYTGKIIDAFMEENYEGPGGAMELLKQWMVILLFGVACTFVQTSLFGLTGERIGNSLRRRLFSSLINKDVEYYDANRTGELLSRISSDTQVVNEGLTTAVAQAAKELTKVAVVCIIIGFYSLPLAAICILCLAPSLYVTNKARSWMWSSGVMVQKAKAEMSSNIEESLTNIRTVKAFGEEKGHVRRFEKANWAVFENGRTRAYLWAIFFCANTLLGQGATVIIILIMSHFFGTFGITAGEATSILLYQRLVAFAIMGVNTHLTNISKVWGSSFKCAQIIVSEKHVLWEGKETIPKNQDGNFDLKDLKFSYPSKKDVQVLKGVDIDVKTNQIVALVGASGCGKSSIISLLERFYDPENG